jgi:alginate O-acetyltransferase complex protein AlgI
MLFTEPLFFLFFAVVFCTYWSLRRDRSRKLWLLASSYAFYAAWDWRFLFLILTSTVVDYLAALGMGSADSERVRRRWLQLSLLANLGLLGFFKYFDFFVESASSVLSMLGAAPLRSYGIVLPVGISFFTFQTMSYSMDVYRRRMEPNRDFADFALFVSFFPQLVMGPILRARSFLPQLRTHQRLADVRFKPLLALFLIGFVKKACISDNIAPLVDSVYADPAAHDVLALWTAMLYYAVQLYCDFSGYTDMAIAVAGLLGFQVAKNFDFPLLAADVSDFWRRWHISFSSWLRDYLYFPMGGSRGSSLATSRNLLVTMLLSGLWHGAGLHFIWWGALNGLALVAHRAWGRARVVPGPLRMLVGRLGVPLTFLWFAFTLIYFRAASVSEAWGVSRAIVLLDSAGTTGFGPWVLVWLPPLALAHYCAREVDIPARAARLPNAIFAAVLGVATGLALAFVRTDYRPFIYFQF